MQKPGFCSKSTALALQSYIGGDHAYHAGNHIGDSWYYVANDLMHCFYLTCPDAIERHTAWDIGRAASPDLINWKIHDLVLKSGWVFRCLAEMIPMHNFFNTSLIS